MDTLKNFVLLIFTLLPATATAQKKVNFSQRAGYLYVYQNNQGNFHTGILEFGIRYKLNQMIYTSIYIGAYPLNDNYGNNAAGGTASTYLGFDIDKFIQLEFGASYHTWADLTEDTFSASSRIIKPLDYKYLSEIFLSMNFTGNSQGATPAYILTTGLGINF